MAVTIINPEAIPADLPPGTYCCRLDESSNLGGFKARLITPPRPHVPGDCLIQLVKQAESPDDLGTEAERMARTEHTDTEG